MTETKSLFTKRTAYKPFWYPWAYDAFVASEQMHWLAREVPLNADVKDWKINLSDDEKALLTQIFRFFTQADCDVSNGYIDKYLPLFKPMEIRMMLGSFVAREAVHIQAYSMLIDEVGMPETEYSMFMEYEAMNEKHEYMYKERTTEEDIAVFSAFGEGLQLFASFVILLNFTRFGKMKGMGQIIAWSIRDESHHVDSMMMLYHEYLREKGITPSSMQERIHEICEEMVTMEDKFIDIAYNGADIEGLTSDEVKKYIRYIANHRLDQLGLDPIYNVQVNPLPWVDEIVNGKEHVNFFENRATDYSKGAVEGSWEDAFGG